ncbi:YybH family protein [Streptomyces sp. 184]|uniref:YybH family protein n=1 Tax=Streptomyces sp. 184 TaxID=1827526 RepID=UPI00389167C4
MSNPNGNGKYELPRTPRELIEVCEKAWNDGNFEELDHLWEPGAVLVELPGKMQSIQELRASSEKLHVRSLSAEMNVQHVYEVGDLALVITDYVHEGKGPDGRHMRLAGTATDIVRRGGDGVWRCVISNPAGIRR